MTTETVNDVDLIRRAATLMRERAEAASPAPWTTGDDGLIWPSRMGDPVAGTGFDNLDDARHIAGAHPAVMRAVADWLDTIAGSHRAVDRVDEETGECVIKTVVWGQPSEARVPAEHILPALRVARAYLAVAP